MHFLGRRNSELRKSSRVAPHNNPTSKSNVSNLSSDHKKHGNGKRKMQSNKTKTNNETTPSNLARQLLQNLNIFSKIYFRMEMYKYTTMIFISRS